MTVLLLAATLAFQLTAAQSARLRWVPNPRVTNGTWVADPSRHLRPHTADSLDALISALERETGVEIAVVAIDSTSGFEPFDVALALHRMWGVGKQGRDNGIVLLWVPAQRAVQISVGYGLEGVLPDARAGRIRDEEIFPAFRRGDFDAGMIAGVTALAAAAREEPNAQGATMSTPGTSGPAGAVQPDDPPAGGRAPAVIGGIGAGLALLAAGAGAWRYRRRRPRKCPNGHGDMVRLDEQADDAHLDRGQRLEEELESVDYDVWVCPTCGHAIREDYKAWFSSYSECKTCGRRTLEKSDKTLRAASTVSEGLKEITEICRNCGARRQYTQTIPRIVQSSSSSSSSGGSSGGGGGGSFGGGSAGGGGAGGRY